ncbi:MAG: trypsin-like peptidase domain-containing protein [Oscillospiraceae bacterium]|nr:trypsin-like peptidase domain-containing protein [Oscillospiraceae bacterium]MCL2279727.1 trypsin-like peptidase domain-containing protein [Oscillospiraceae bacterium]
MYTPNDEKRDELDNLSEYSHNPVSEPPPREPSHSEPVYSEPICTTEPSHSEPIYTDPTHSHPMYSERSCYEQPYGVPSHQEPQKQILDAYAPPQDASSEYSIFSRNSQVYTAPKREKGSKKVSAFLKVACLVLVCALMSAASAYLVMEFRFQRGDFIVNQQVVLGGVRPDNDLTAQVATLADENMRAQDIYDMALTQVVGIRTQIPSVLPFREADSENRVTPVSGSGFIISSDGYILTNYHVIEMAHRSNLPISVVLEDGSEYIARIVGFEATNDVALLKINATGLNPAILGDSDDIRVGERVYAVGNPLGDLAYTMTEGIISALDRVVTVDRITINAFQFSAAVNRGNSGGPIYNQRGEVIGIVTAKVIRGNVEGIGFAIPINDAVEIATALIEDGYISGRPLIGVTIVNVNPIEAEHYGRVPGVAILSVNSDSAADNAGLEVGDIIVSLGDESVTSVDSLRQTLRSHYAGDTTEITVWREGETLVLTITFDEDFYAGRPDRPNPEPLPQETDEIP